MNTNAENGERKVEGEPSLALNLPQDYAWAITQHRLTDVVEQLRGSRDAAAMGRRVEYAGPMVFDVESGIAEIAIAGVLTQRTGYFQYLYGGSGTAEIAAAVSQASADERVRAILLCVDSPGGQTKGIPDLADTIYAARKSKPVFAQVLGMCASAGLWVASQADKMFAGRMDEIGSIGVRMLLMDTSRLYANEGIDPVLITTGEHKATGVAGIRITDAQRAELQANVDAWQDEFVAALVRGRGLTEAAVRTLADGRTWLAPQAVANGLIDGIQSKAETLAQLVARAKPPATSNRKVSYPMTTPAPAADATPAPAPEAAKPAAPQPATLAQLKADFPQASAEWRETQLLAGATLDQAKTAYIKHLTDTLAANDAAHKQALEAAQAATPAPAKLPGAEPLQTNSTGTAAGGETGDAVADFHAAVSAEMKRSNCARHVAHRTVCRKQPDLRKAMLAAHNARAAE